MSLPAVLRPKSIALDAAVVAAAIVGANLLFDRAHPGWTNLNPSPYLLLPLLLGGRYGFLPGILAGLTASALIVLQQMGWAGPLPAAPPASVRAALTDTPYLHASLVFIGALCGELFGWFRREHLLQTALLLQVVAVEKMVVLLSIMP